MAQRLLLGLSIGLATAVVVAGSTPARALTLTPQSVSFDFGGTGDRAGRIDFLGTSVGVPAGGIVLEGSIGPAQEVYRFQLVLEPSSAALGGFSVGATVGATITPRTPSGGGTTPGANVPISGVLPAIAGIGLEYVFGAGLGATSDELFIAFDDLAVGDLIQFGFRRGNIAVDFVQMTVVPEPESSLLMLGGLTLLGTVAARSSRKRADREGRRPPLTQRPRASAERRWPHAA